MLRVPSPEYSHNDTHLPPIVQIRPFAASTRRTGSLGKFAENSDDSGGEKLRVDSVVADKENEIPRFAPSLSVEGGRGSVETASPGDPNMALRRFGGKQMIFGLAAFLCFIGAGCMGHDKGAFIPPPPGVIPSELSKVTLPPYVIEAPDVLLIEVYADSLDVTKPPVALWPQSISGQHLVRIDGTVGLGIWGEVNLSGKSMSQATELIRQHVFKRMQQDKRIGDKFKVDVPEKLLVIVDVLAYNSKTYYVIADGGGFGEQIYPFSITGNETVLDALAKISGLPDIASKRDIWLARRSPMPGMGEQIMPVDYVAITQHAIAQTNYQVMPGDRIYVKAQQIVRIDRFLQKALSPLERLLGITLLGSSTVNSIQNRTTSTSGQ
jgi:polysaccharide export outer membrane protein